MSVEKAKEFIEAVMADEKLKEKMEGFNFEDMKAAAEELKKEKGEPAPGVSVMHW
jgi:hypothetical protein